MSYKIPLFDLNYGEEEIQAVAGAVHDNWISMGPRCEKLEALFSSMTQSKYALSVDNCTNALHLALRVLDIGPGDEVLVPSLTFVATVNSVRYVGATPVFCDIVDPQKDMRMSPVDIAAKITPRTKAVIVMHYGGFPCDMDAILSLTKKHGLKLIEDACHSPLSEYKGRCTGTMGDVGCFSFFSNKNISTGEGGMMTFQDEGLYQRSKLLRSHGMTTTSYQRAGGHSTRYDVTELGYNFRMDDIRAALGIVQLGKLSADLKKRAEVRTHYEEALQDIEGITVPFLGHNGFVSNYIFAIVLYEGGSERRDRMRDYLHAQGIQTSFHYPPVHQFSIYASSEIDLPYTDEAANHLITLPMYSKLTKDDVLYIADVLRKGLNS